MVGTTSAGRDGKSFRRTPRPRRGERAPHFDLSSGAHRWRADRRDDKPDRVNAASILPPLEAAVARFPGVRVALLFGSFARDRARDDSDIDLAVLGDVDPFAMSGALSTALRREVDVVMINEATIPLLDAIVRDGVLVFEAERGAAAILRARLLASLETDRPWYERMQRAWLARVAARGVLG